MKLNKYTANQAKLQKELKAFEKMLKKGWLSEKDDISPLFKKSPNLCAALGDILPGVAVDRVSTEALIWHECRADIVIASAAKGEIRLIELEDAQKNSIFEGSKDSRNWGKRMEHGFSQLVDWFYAFDSRKGELSREFDFEVKNYSGLLIVGRSNGVSLKERDRINFRSIKVIVDSRKIVIMTYDDIYEVLKGRIASAKVKFKGKADKLTLK